MSNNKETKEKEKLYEKWWNSEMRIKTENGVPDLPIFLLNANLKKNGSWIYFVLLNISHDKEENKINLLRLFFLIKWFPMITLEKDYPKEVKVWKELREKLDKTWKSFSEQKVLEQYWMLKKRKTRFHLFFNKFKAKKFKRKEKEQETSWKEWEVLSKASFSHDFHLLGEVICNIITFFSERGKIEKITASKEVGFEINFGIDEEKKPDILVISEKSKKELGIEIVEIYSSLVKIKGKKKTQALEKIIPSAVEEKVVNSIVEYKEIRQKLVKNAIKGIKGVKLLSIQEKDDVFGATWNISEKNNNFNHLLDNLKKTIEIKNDKHKKKKINNVALWTILSASFSIYLHNTSKGHLEFKEEMQKDFLSWFLLKGISEKLSNVDIEFGYIIVTFLNSHYCDKSSFLSKYNPFGKIEREEAKKSNMFLELFMKDDDLKVVIPNFYIPVVNKKIVNLKANLETKKIEFKRKWNFDIDSLLYYEIGSSSYSFFASNVRNTD